jgi:hypothetical protein
VRGRDVHQHEGAVERPGRPLIPEQCADPKGPCLVAHRKLQGRTRTGARAIRRLGNQSVPSREDFGDDHRRRVEQESEEGLRRGLPVAGPDIEPVVAYRLIAQDVHAEDTNRFGAIGRQQGERIALDDGTDIAPGAQPGEFRQPGLVDAESRADDFKRRLARDGVERG